MITGKGILWAPIETITSDRRDGRTMLLWADGDTIRGRWAVNPPGRKNWSGWEEPDQWHAINGVSHWADINPPE
jgi:hypothetical protein